LAFELAPALLLLWSLAFGCELAVALLLLLSFAFGCELAAALLLLLSFAFGCELAAALLLLWSLAFGCELFVAGSGATVGGAVASFVELPLLAGVGDCAGGLLGFAGAA
jgi:hypothetical protein